MRRALWVVSALSLALALIAFAVANREPVLLQYPMTEGGLRLPLHLVFFAGLIFGVCLAGVVTLWPRLRNRLSGRKLRRRAEAAEARANALETEAPPRTAERLAAIDRAQSVDAAADPHDLPPQTRRSA